MRTLAGILTLLVASAASAQHPPFQAIPVDLAVPMPPTPVRAEGSTHLLYELHVTNFGRQELTLERLDVIAPNAVIVRTYADSSLQSILTRTGIQVADRRVIGPGLRAVIFIDVAMPDSQPYPKSLVHRLTFSPVSAPDAGVQSVVQGGEVRPASATGALGPPVEGSGWIALHALSNNSGHRRTIITLDGEARISQRFAIDWSRVADDGQVFHGDPANNANWVPYGADVLAVADGVVVDLQDNIPENNPTSTTRAVPIDLQTVGGNYIVLNIGVGRFVFYAHLKPGSLCVAVGQRVRRGQVIGRIGNSGQADAPHLHIHIMNRASPLASEGLPLIFERFELMGHVQSLQVLTDGTGWRPTAPPELRRREMPVENAVVGFGKVPKPAATCRSR